ncbi:MAG: response regulator, partial [Actinomycetota bacterium]|nr:response regulator [Actinomycetota bacterium]
MTGAKARVLAVDDERYITDLLAAALRFEGFDVETVGTGVSALEAARRSGFDLIVLDVLLPDLEGTEVCRRLREEGIETPVL